MRYTFKHWSSKQSEKYRHFANKFWKGFRQNLRRNIDIFRKKKKNQTHFRWNIDISQTNFENHSDTFSRGILTFRRQIFRKNQTNFQKKMKFLRHILIKSQKHFQENIVPSRICLIFFKFVWNLVPENIEKSIWAVLWYIFWMDFRSCAWLVHMHVF